VREKKRGDKERRRERGDELLPDEGRDEAQCLEDVLGFMQLLVVGHAHNNPDTAGGGQHGTHCF
jgi:hypothetical protein